MEFGAAGWREAAPSRIFRAVRSYACACVIPALPDGRPARIPRAVDTAAAPDRAPGARPRYRPVRRPTT